MKFWGLLVKLEKILNNKFFSLEKKTSLNKKETMSVNKLDKKGAVGAAMTWVVATFIILFLLILFIYSSYAMAKEREIKKSDGFILENKKVIGMDSEQILLALLKTRVGEITISNYIFQGDYEEVESSVKSILNELPELKGKAIVYIGDKKVELNKNSLEVEDA